MYNWHFDIYTYMNARTVKCPKFFTGLKCVTSGIIVDGTLRYYCGYESLQYCIAKHWKWDGKETPHFSKVVLWEAVPKFYPSSELYSNAENYVSQHHFIAAIDYRINFRFKLSGFYEHNHYINRSSIIFNPSYF